jgi:hypothetical protein
MIAAKSVMIVLEGASFLPTRGAFRVHPTAYSSAISSKDRPVFSAIWSKGVFHFFITASSKLKQVEACLYDLYERILIPKHGGLGVTAVNAVCFVRDILHEYETSSL